MKHVLEQVRLFNETGRVAMPGFDAADRDLRIRLLEEEWNEYLEAEGFDDLVGIADALADMIYIIAGTALVYGIPLDRVFDEVQRSNMSKFADGVNVREDGKILKGASYSPLTSCQY